MNDWIKINIEALVHRSEIPSMTPEQEQVFVSTMSSLLGEWLPTGQEWIDCVVNALHSAGVKAPHED